ncbi:MAG: dTDP-4-dehydrorhamnose reductase [Candidatus Andersenbacteria bacterium RIFCSPHIGHO2_01_FULL_46_36]|uniref:dTDP-4-dehydrorhamnose reductase n=1 Tax=Candidatus Andersenbacteria bacterium RIFCSPHIGHO2_12_FULL_45_11 TaxID=1797281 RepID=A0A1G1X0Y4_9BACT|nr:MAG: dTDP-4-dehydrorhamnose reductase [Candidatus Andersenbacteria bacterium RIFCSPHIGHO2_01_FULL_46_36]OGY33672.1 MAG: dTDP-4-dehydrorhamnose reductase [Candidatus Andersenbacteria bacterium RIFCSPHIGHO2_12_FULL_45_11]
MSFVIVGAKGMLGSMLSVVFADKHPILLDKDEIDITNETSVRKALRDAGATHVINAAAYTNVDGAEEHSDTAFAVNEIGVKNLGLICRELSATLVHFSTDYVFPGTNEDGYTEADSPGPAINVYGQSKLAGERALKESGCNFYLVRTAWLYGPNGKNFVDTMLQLAQKQDHLQVVSDQRGCPTYTKDLAEYVRTLLEGAYPFGIYHGVNTGNASWFEFAQKIFEYTSSIAIVVKPISSAQFPRPAKRPAFSILQNTKGPSMRSWQDALAEYVRGV